MVSLQIWNSSAWVNATPKVWDGSAWGQVQKGYVWNGSVWTEFYVFFSVTFDTTTVSGGAERLGPGTVTATTTSVSLVPSDNTGFPWTTNWQLQSGTGATVNSTNALTTTFSRTATATLEGNTVEGVYKCVLTHTNGQQATTTNSLTVTTTHTRVE